MQTCKQHSSYRSRSSGIRLLPSKTKESQESIPSVGYHSKRAQRAFPVSDTSPCERANRRRRQAPKQSLEEPTASQTRRPGTDDDAKALPVQDLKAEVRRAHSDPQDCNDAYARPNVGWRRTQAQSASGPASQDPKAKPWGALSRG